MDILLSELMERTRNYIRSFELSPATVSHYQTACQALADYFLKHDQSLFSRPLAEQYLRESKAKLEAGIITRRRYQLGRQSVHMLLEYYESGQVAWKYHEDPPVYLHQAAYLRLQTDYLNHLHAEEKGAGTLQ